MKCRAVRRKLSEFRDGDLIPSEGRLVGAHLEACSACRERLDSLERTLDVLSGLPRVEGCGIADRILDHLEVENRGPGLARLFRPISAARPLMLPSLVSAALVFLGVVGGALALDGPGSWRADGVEAAAVPSGTEANPVFLSEDVQAPRIRERGPSSRLLAEMVGGTLFVETVVARDGSVSAVTLLAGDRAEAGPLLNALRKDRFEPARFAGRPVAASVIRLISHMEVWARTT